MLPPMASTAVAYLTRSSSPHFLHVLKRTGFNRRRAGGGGKHVVSLLPSTHAYFASHCSKYTHITQRTYLLKYTQRKYEHDNGKHEGRSRHHPLACTAGKGENGHTLDGKGKIPIHTSGRGKIILRWRREFGIFSLFFIFLFLSMGPQYFLMDTVLGVYRKGGCFIFN